MAAGAVDGEPAAAPAREPRGSQRLDPETRRAQLVAAAVEVFRGRDPNEVSFEEVAEAAGVSRSLVYAYFQDRGGLIAEVYLHNVATLDAELSKALDTGLAEEAQLRRIVRRYLVFARDNEPAWTLLNTAGRIQHPAVQQARRDRIERIAARWDDEKTARIVAQAVIGLLEAGARDWLDYRDRGLDRTTDLLVALVWSGLAGLSRSGVLVAR
ncbi:MAG: TetR/AcrR family transcriptional regulator [Actinomycetota bacterium]